MEMVIPQSLDLIGNIDFDDDGPSASLSAAEMPTLEVDESDLSIDFSECFDTSFGADGGCAVSDTVRYELDAKSTNVESGLTSWSR